ELNLVRSALLPYADSLKSELWSVIEKSPSSDRKLLASASALALYDANDERWSRFGDKVAQSLVAVESGSLAAWLDIFHPIRGRLMRPIVAIFRDEALPEWQHVNSASILSDFAEADPESLANLLMEADARAFRNLFPAAIRLKEQISPVFRGELKKT